MTDVALPPPARGDVGADLLASIGTLLDGLAVQVTVTHNLTRAQLSRWVREAAASELGVSAQPLA